MGEKMKKILLIVLLLTGTNMILSAGSEIELLGQACDGGYAAKCYDLGVVYRDGQIADQDSSKAKELFKKACNGGDTRGCAALEVKNEADRQGEISTSHNCPRQSFRKYAEELDKNKIESVKSLKDYYTEMVSRQSVQCRSLLFSDFRKFYQQITKAYILSAENSLNEKYPLPPKKEKKYKAELAKAGLLIYQSEGMYYVEDDSGWFLEEFGTSLPDAWKEFLKQGSHEEKNRFIDDAAVMISWEQLRKRVIFWEKFLDAYPDFVEKSTAEEYLSLYVSTYMRGSDNSPIYDWDTKKVFPEIRNSYEKFIKLNQKSKYYEMVKKQYDIIKNGAFAVDQKTSKQLDINYESYKKGNILQKY